MRRVAFLLLFCLLGLTACGSSDDSVDTLLSKTFGSSKAVKSGRVNAQIDANVLGIQGLQGLRLRLNGPFRSNGTGRLPSFDFTLGMTSGRQSLTAGGVSTGTKGWLRFNGQVYVVPDDVFKRFSDGYLAAAKKSQNQHNGTPSLAGLGVNPRSWLRNAHKVGEEDVAGTKTIHIAAGLDVGRLLDDVNRLISRAGSAAKTQQVQKLSDTQRRQIEQAVRSATVDVFTGKDDKLLRRLDVRVGLQRSGRVQGGQLRFQLELDAVNQGQEIKPPANAKPLSDLVNGLQGGTLPGASTGSSGSAAAPPDQNQSYPPTTSAGQKYLQCLQKAGDDVGKLQQCAALQQSG
jgi:hypothetical protein